MQVEQEIMKVGLNRKDALSQSNRIFGNNQITSRLNGIWPPPFWETIVFKSLVSFCFIIDLL